MGHIERRNHLFTKLSADNPVHQPMSQIYFCIIHYIRWWRVNAGTQQIVTRVRVRTKRGQLVCTSNLGFCSDNFYIWNQCHVRFPSFNYRKKELVLMSDSCFFALHEIHILLFFNLIFQILWTQNSMATCKISCT